MSITADIRLQVRQRAHFACEYCGVSETDTGGELTVDHFHPQTKGGTDDPDNLLYCCNRCNQYKADYWPNHSTDPVLWNPRREPIATHLLSLADGTLYPITPIGSFTLKRLRLNRPPLIAYRLQQHYRAEEIRLQRSGFDQLLAAAVHSSFVAGVYPDQAAWADVVARSSVRLQWDPDHDPGGAKVERRAIQLGLRDQALAQYAHDWLIEIENISAFVAEQREYAQTTTTYAQLWTPREDIYPVQDVDTAQRLGISND